MRKDFGRTIGPVKKTNRGLVDGRTRWVEKAPSPILTCACTRRYIKTRPSQDACLPCFLGIGNVANFRDGG